MPETTPVISLGAFTFTPWATAWVETIERRVEAVPRAGGDGAIAATGKWGARRVEIKARLTSDSTKVASGYLSDLIREINVGKIALLFTTGIEAIVQAEEEVEWDYVFGSGGNAIDATIALVAEEWTFRRTTQSSVAVAPTTDSAYNFDVSNTTASVDTPFLLILDSSTSTALPTGDYAVTNTADGNKTMQLSIANGMQIGNTFRLEIDTALGTVKRIKISDSTTLDVTGWFSGELFRLKPNAATNYQSNSPTGGVAAGLRWTFKFNPAVVME